MKRYRVKLTYPTALLIGEMEYLLFPGQITELPDAKIVETYLGLGYIEPMMEV